MPNDLTGDFDVVAEFAVPAVNRMLAAMHRLERFPHSLTLRVDDNTPPGWRFDMPSVMGVIDSFGDAVTDHSRIPPSIVWPPPATTSDGFRPAFDPVVNLGTVGVRDEPIVPSRFQGRAQVQLSPPTIEVADSSGSRVTVRLEMICRYIADPQTSRAAEFVRGTLRITAPVDQAASQLAKVVTIDIKASTAHIAFTPDWSSSPLSAEDLAGINLLMRNALKTGFLPSDITLPDRLDHAQFKMLTGAQSAVAVMIDVARPAPAPPVAAGDRASLDDVFLATGDDFAFAVGSDFVHEKFQPTIDDIMSQPIAPVSFPVNGLVHTWHVTYTVALTGVTLALENGKIVLTMTGRARTGSWTPNFGFTIRQSLSLSVDGPTANLSLGDLSFDPSGWVISAALWIVGLFSGGARRNIAEMRDKALEKSGARQTIRQLLSADENLGAFLRSLLSPARGKPVLAVPAFSLAYTSAEIRPSGIVLHGSLGLISRQVQQMPRVEYEQIPQNGQGTAGIHPVGGTVAHGPEYSAFKSWIPGGTVRQYEWKSQGQTGPGHIEANRFVFMRRTVTVIGVAGWTNAVSGYSPLCLTMRGTRLSSSGPVVDQAVTATVCGYGSFPIVGDLGAFADGAMPMVALTRPGPGGLVEVEGHTAARATGGADTAPNLIVHFADENSAGQLDRLEQALSESGRRDAATAIVVVMNAEQLTRARYFAHVTYAVNIDDSWERQFGVEGRRGRGAMTVVVEPRGKVVWRHEGEVDGETLAKVLAKNLVTRKPVEITMLPPSARIGQPPPNFIFEHAPGRELTLRKISGRPIALVFWKSSSAPSVEAVRDAQRDAQRDGEGQHGLVLAINDGESPESALKAATEAGLSATIVTDPERRISLAYGVTIWPTLIGIDSTGVVRTVNYGRGAVASHPDSNTPSQRSSAP